MGRDRGKTRAQSGGGGCHVPCGGRKRVKVTKKGKKWMERKRGKKNDKSGKKKQKKGKIFLFLVLGRIDP